MSEHLKKSPESGHESLNLSKEYQENKKRIDHEQTQTTPETIDADDVREQIEQHAISSKEHSTAEITVEPTVDYGQYASLKQQTYNRTLGRIQSRLSPSNRALSKITHNETVDAVSNGVGKTVARPSGILGGGIVAFIGSIVVLYMAKKYGFEYNFFMFFVFLAGGFIIGVAIEYLVYGLRKLRR